MFDAHFLLKLDVACILAGYSHGTACVLLQFAQSPPSLSFSPSTATSSAATRLYRLYHVTAPSLVSHLVSKPC